MSYLPPSQQGGKKKNEVYKDPIYGIPHFHDPALLRIIQKHDPNYQINQSMKAIALRSKQRVRAVSANKPKYLHTRFNIETLTTSPLMCFPHFQDMTNFLMNWFETKDKKEKELVTSNQKLIFQEYAKFCNALFLLLQETARAQPLSPKPLIGIYSWYLQRDAIIYQSRSTTQQDQKSQFITIELTNGQVVEINKAYLDVNQVLANSDKWHDKALSQIGKPIPPPVVEEKVIPKRTGSKITRIIKDPILPKPIKQPQETFLLYEDFDYPALHKRLVEERQAEIDVDRLAKAERDRKKEEIKGLSGFQ